MIAPGEGQVIIGTSGPELITVCVQIGNSDDRLTQARWSAYVKDTHAQIKDHAHEIHFHGFSSPGAPWQNACWVFTINPVVAKNILRPDLALAAHHYRQDSIAWLRGITEFVVSNPHG